MSAAWGENADVKEIRENQLSKHNVYHKTKLKEFFRDNYARKDLTDTPQTCFKVWRDILCFFRAVVHLHIRNKFYPYIPAP